MSKRVALNRLKWNVVWLLSLAGCLTLMIGVLSATADGFEEAGQPADGGAKTPPPEKMSDSDCGRCHSCARPTPEHKCPPTCTRKVTPERKVTFADQGPDVVILNELEDAYLPVPFDHRGHAEMAEMVHGCVTCHHHTPEGQRHPACRTCHDISVAGTDLFKPGLKGAYHQQCLNCHRDWIDETDCAKCHVPKAGRPKGDNPAAPLRKDLLLGQMHPLAQMHPPIPEPVTVIYRPESRQAGGSRVMFRHQEHVRRFGLKCVECHHEPNCARCHIKQKEHRRPRRPTEPHKPCSRCHERDMDQTVTRIAGRCKRCHWREGQPEPKRFDHADTGWPLSRFHEDQRCRDCHATVPFTKLDNNCNTCHSRWSPAVFDHRATGQVLDDNHAEHDCALCHVERRFDRPPTCDECHDAEDDGITFPARRPGPGLRFEPSKPGNGSVSTERGRAAAPRSY